MLNQETLWMQSVVLLLENLGSYQFLREHSGQSSGKGEFHRSFTCNGIPDSVNKKVEFESGNKSYLFSVSKVDQILQKIGRTVVIL